MISPGDRLGRFRVVESLPHTLGGMATIVIARADCDRGLTALKISRIGRDSSWFFAAMHREVEVLRRISYSGVVSLREISPGSSNSYMQRAVQLPGAPWYFGMEFLSGGSLESCLKQWGRLDLDEGVGLGLRLCDVLEQVHGTGYAHNDLKAENILFRTPLEAGTPFIPVLIDFGLAARFHRIQCDGSISYMAPERLSMENDDEIQFSSADGIKSDIWSLGALLYRCFSGIDPFLRSTERRTARAICREAPRPLVNLAPRIPRLLEELILDGCLAKDPVFRPGVDEISGHLSSFHPSGIVLRSAAPGLIGIARKMAAHLIH